MLTHQLEITLILARATVRRSAPTREVIVLAPIRAYRVWDVEVEVSVTGRASFVLTEQLALPAYRVGPRVGGVLPAIVHPARDEAALDFGDVPGFDPDLDAELTTAGVRVLVSDDLVDPVEINGLLQAHLAPTAP